LRLPDAVLFDTDNTLYPYDPAHAAAQQAVKEKVMNTFSISGKDFDEAFSEARKQIKTRLGHTASSHSRLLYLQRMLEIMGLGSQVLLALDFEQTYWRRFLANAILFEEVKEFVKRVVPDKYTSGKLVSEKGRVLSNDEFLTADEILKNDVFFKIMRENLKDKDSEE
jgi:hypothetical protein